MGWRADGGLWLLVRGGGLFLSKGTGVSHHSFQLHHFYLLVANYIAGSFFANPVRIVLTLPFSAHQHPLTGTYCFHI